jgi:hypothetical protein
MRQSAVRLHLGGWSIEIPEEWDHSFDEGSLALTRGTSELRISSIGTTDASDITDADLLEFIDELGMSEATRFRTSHGPFTGYHFHDDREVGHAVQHWLVASGPTLLLVQYRCHEDRSGTEDEEVREALDSLRLDETQGQDR